MLPLAPPFLPSIHASRLRLSHRLPLHTPTPPRRQPDHSSSALFSPEHHLPRLSIETPCLARARCRFPVAHLYRRVPRRPARSPKILSHAPPARGRQHCYRRVHAAPRLSNRLVTHAPYPHRQLLDVSLASAAGSAVAVVTGADDRPDRSLPNMATVNIRRDVDDKFYRYKMPVLLTKIEGRGNGIKTVVPNMEDVARALDRPPSYPTKFFGTELGAQTTMADDRYIVNGAHQADRLRELLDVFIDKFVLCASCKNPETELIISGRRNHENIHRDCKACGSHTDIDMRHKLTTFILKNPPKKVGKKGKGMTAEANVGGPQVFEAKAQDGSDDDDASPAHTPGAGNGGVPTKGTDIDAALGKIDPVLDNPDVAAAKLKDLTVGDDDDDEDADSPYAQLGVWLEENRDAADADIIGKLKELDIVGKHKALISIGHKLFTDGVANELGKRAALLKVLVTSEKHQKSLLGGLERLLALSPESDALLAQGTTAKALMALYQADVLDEDVVRQWGTHVSKKYVSKDQSKKVRKSAEPFLKWLEDADDESEEDSE